MRNNLDTDPDVIYMARQLEIHECYVVGLLHKFWSWADQHAASGILRKILPTWIDRFVSCPGFSDALISVGWLITESDSLILPHWNRHNGSSAKTRARDLFRKKARRNNGEEDNQSEHPNTCPNNSGQNLDEHPDTCPKKSGQNLNESSDECPEKSGKNSDKIRTREEKSREEYREEKINTLSKNESARERDVGENFSAESEAEPLNNEEYLGKLRHEFPDRDVDGELKSFLKYCHREGGVAKRSGFITWLKKAGPTIQEPKSEFSY